MTKTQVDRLGDRLRTGTHSEADLIQLTAYRDGFAPAYGALIGVMRDELGIEPTGRPAKSTSAIIDKLSRESIRLSQIQDIAGCRVVLPGVKDQNTVVESIVRAFERVTVVDRRQNPSHGYRAVHVIPIVQGLPVEIQVRTGLQHHWAELSEKLSDLVDPRIKYGTGPLTLQKALSDSSSLVAEIEDVEMGVLRFQHLLDNAGVSQPELVGKLAELQEGMIAIRVRGHESLDSVLVNIRELAQGA
jgi:putative GTP pyrophosphokinase